MSCSATFGADSVLFPWRARVPSLLLRLLRAKAYNIVLIVMGFRTSNGVVFVVFATLTCVFVLHSVGFRASSDRSQRGEVSFVLYIRYTAVRHFIGIVKARSCVARPVAPSVASSRRPSRRPSRSPCSGWWWESGRGVGMGVGWKGWVTGWGSG